MTFISEAKFLWGEGRGDPIGGLLYQSRDIGYLDILFALGCSGTKKKKTTIEAYNPAIGSSLPGSIDIV